MWPVKIVPEMTYNVLSGMLSLYIIAITVCDVFFVLVLGFWLNLEN